jgi:hypothetical protein
MLSVLLFFVVLGVVSFPLFARFFTEERRRSRMEMERKTAQAVRIGRRAHRV